MREIEKDNSAEIMRIIGEALNNKNKKTIIIKKNDLSMNLIIEL